MAAAVQQPTLLLNIADMIDLSIGAPEGGVVDFNMLHTVLHCLAQQLQVLEKNVELRGDIAMTPVGDMENMKTVDIQEFEIETDGVDGPQGTILFVEKIPKLSADATKNSPLKPGKADQPPHDWKKTGKEVPKGAKVSAKTKQKYEGGKTSKQKATEQTTGTVGGWTEGGTLGSTVEGTETGAQGGTPEGSERGTGGETQGDTQTVTQGETQIVTQGVAQGEFQGVAQGESQGSTQGETQSQTSGGKSSDDKRKVSGETLSLVTLSKFNLLENVVKDLKTRIYGSIPKNEEMIEEVRSQTNLKSITDMWTSLNVSSRLEAAESAIDRLSSLIEDLIGDNSNLREAIKTCQSSVTAMDAVKQAIKDANTMKDREAASIGAVAAAEAGMGMSGGQEADIIKALPPGTTADLSTIQGAVLEIRGDVDNLAKAFYISQATKGGKSGDGGGTGVGVGAGGGIQADTGTGVHGGMGVDGGKWTGTVDSYGKPGPELYDMLVRVNDIDNRLKECCENIRKYNGKMNDKMVNLQDQLEGVLKQMSEVAEGAAAGLSKDMIKDLKGLMQLFHTVQEMQQELKQVHETALQLAAEKENRQQNLNAIIDQIELLKTIKMDREDIIEAMAEKADMSSVARKVSFDQFEMACDDLSKGLDHALGKLGLQESIWQQALDDIQREIESKLDKIELMPVKEFFNKKLRELQESLRQIALLRREAEAAGTKRRLLRDVNCISCDAKACMQTEPTQVAVQRPFPATLSMKPYLSYELDSIRKTQQCSVPQRNMHDWEQIDRQTKAPQRVRSETDKHICNRYCGGSHTTTTPAQRVARTGHFIKQWGPDVLPLSSGFAAGDDGRMYKISGAESAGVGPGGAAPKPVGPPEKVKTPRRWEMTKRPSINECRCLEGTETGKDQAPPGKHQPGKERPVSAK